MFELSPAGDKWTEKVLYSFRSSNDVSIPFAGVIFDASRNLYGTASAGTGVFELTPSGTGWKEHVIYYFTGPDGSGPTCDLLWDAAGSLYGTTQAGGKFNKGVVFQLTPSTGGDWTETVLHDFTGNSDGKYPAAGLVSDTAGNLYGTAQECTSKCAGTVFTLTRSMGGWTFGVLHAFKGSDGGPYSGVTFDASGNLFGTTTGGLGTVYRLSPSGGGWKESVIHHFDRTHGWLPYGGVIFGPMGMLYGIAGSGGSDDWGVVFSLAP